MGRLSEFGPVEGWYLAGLPVDKKALDAELTGNLPKPTPKEPNQAEAR